MANQVEKIIFIHSQNFTKTTDEEGNEILSDVWQKFPDAVNYDTYYANAYLESDEQEIVTALDGLEVTDYQIKTQQEAIVFADELVPENPVI